MVFKIIGFLGPCDHICSLIAIVSFDECWLAISEKIYLKSIIFKIPCLSTPSDQVFETAAHILFKKKKGVDSVSQ